MIDAIQTIGALSNMAATDTVSSSLSSSMSAAQTSLSLTQGVTTQGAAMQGAGASQSFSSVLGTMATDMVNNLKQAEASSIKGIRGEADTREVVDAVMNAEQSLQTAMAIRDKLVTAYLEIARMPI